MKTFKITLAVFILTFLFGLKGVMANPEDNTLNNVESWTKKQEIKITQDKLSGTNNLVDFPTLITENNIDSAVFTEAQNNGCDIRFSLSGDEKNPGEIPFEKVLFSKESGKMEFWVKQSLLTNNTNSIWIWWGNNMADCYLGTSVNGSNNVWKDSYKAVWHFNEESGARHDSTKNNNDLVDHNSVGYAGGKWSGNSADFELDNSEYLEIKNEDQTDLNFANRFTVMAWIKPETLNINQIVYERGGALTDDLQHRILVNKYNDFSVGYRGGNLGYTTSQPIKNDWQYIAGMISFEEQKTYYNGDFIARTTYPVATKQGDYDFGVGRRYFIDLPNYFDGAIDELRLCAEILSDDWIKTEYNNQNDPASFAIGQKVEDVNVKKITPIILIPGTLGSMKNSKGEWLLDPLLHTYDNLWKAFVTAGYEEGETLFGFPYDWKQYNAVTANLLRDKIAEIKASKSATKVDIVAHSMGGLVARSYIEGSNYANDVDQLIFLGTPQQGASEAYITWEGAEFGRDIKSLLAKKLMEQIVKHIGFTGKNNLYNYIHNMVPSVSETLPVYNYLGDDGEPGFRVYPLSYPQNIFLEQLNSASSLSKLSPVKITNIVANDGNKTIDSLTLIDSTKLPLWEHGMPINYYGNGSGVVKGGGDGTVPTRSNLAFFGADKDIVINSTHRHMVTDGQADVLHELTGNNYGVIYNKEYDSTLLVRVMSPVDFMVKNPSAKRLGKDFVNSLELNEIEEAYYSGFNDENEFATIVNPVAGLYNVDMQGTVDGEYQLLVSYLEDGLEIDKEFTGLIKNGQLVNFTFSFDENNKSISELNPIDTVAPVIIVNSPTNNSTYSTNQNVAVSYSVSDDFSGVKKTDLYLDDSLFTGSSIDMSTLSLGVHKLRIVSFDRVDNQSAQSIQFEITKLESVFDIIFRDLEKLKAGGEIVKNPIYELLKNTLKHLEIKYNIMMIEKNPLKKYLLGRYIDLQLQIMKIELDFDLHKKWITKNATEVLKGDVQKIRTVL